ncbi:DeoR/GlpR family DNA-binding transcription regulator [Paenibacillus kobensis]|uniref:DeoR/GlpR family DNA-binding transcription regulator n=1 Tax=Paenibacillus kobensis TaxID=59841 RepID=UPI000FDAAB4D|nr:DeoR/GlpR family DNA-binding transcription regulator [Paenibacillus kobensis]
MLAEERRQLILERLSLEGRVVAKELAHLFQLSIDSIRRDLTIMEDQGLLQKTYGGAIPFAETPKVRTMAQPPAVRYGAPKPHQDAISKAAASYIQRHDTVFIGGAGIHYGMLKHIPDELPITVVTNSLAIAEHIRHRPHIDSYLIGGKLRANSSGGNIIDTIACEMISRFNFDIGFVTGGGISLGGISMATPEGAAIIRAVAAVSRRTVCLAPHEKIGVTMFAGAIPLNQIKLLIADQGAPEKFIHEFNSRNVKVIFADEDYSSGGNNHEGN